MSSNNTQYSKVWPLIQFTSAQIICFVMFYFYSPCCFGSCFPPGRISSPVIFKVETGHLQFSVVYLAFWLVSSAVWPVHFALHFFWSIHVAWPNWLQWRTKFIPWLYSAVFSSSNAFRVCHLLQVSLFVVCIICRQNLDKKSATVLSWRSFFLRVSLCKSVYILFLALAVPYLCM